jgi:uncharacterized protein YcfJ
MQNRLTMLPRLVLWTAFAFGLTACSSLTHRERNTFTGAAIGGVIGHQVGAKKKK